MTGYDLYLIIATLLYIGLHIYADKVIKEIKERDTKKDKKDK